MWAVVVMMVTQSDVAPDLSASETVSFLQSNVQLVDLIRHLAEFLFRLTTESSSSSSSSSSSA